MQNRQIPFEITKANGEKSVFDHNKLFSSLTRSGADEAHEIVRAITAELYPGISRSFSFNAAMKKQKYLSYSLIR